MVGHTMVVGNMPDHSKSDITSYNHLCIDGKNNLYRSIFAGYADKRFRESGNDYSIIFIRFLAHYINKFKPKSVHMFWDAPSSTLWRKNIYPSYKEHRHDAHKKYEIDVKKTVTQQMGVLIQILKNLNVHQYFVDGHEADDLIYAFAYVNLADNILIVSSDGDLNQIPYKFNNIKVHNPLSKRGEIEPKPELDPVIVKSIIGDTADNIPGYFRIGKIRVKPFASDVSARRKFLNSDKAQVSIDGQPVFVGDNRFNFNRLIIDLNLNPYLKDNLIYIEKRQSEPLCYNLGEIERIAQRYKLRGLMSAISSLVLPMRYLQ